MTMGRGRGGDLQLWAREAALKTSGRLSRWAVEAWDCLEGAEGRARGRESEAGRSRKTRVGGHWLRLADTAAGRINATNAANATLPLRAANIYRRQTLRR